jgi:plastocyanin
MHTHRIPRIFVGIVLLVGLLLAACGTQSTAGIHPGPNAKSTSATIVISNFQFIPDEVTVHDGEELIIHNEDQVNHTFTAVNRAFNTGIIPPGHTVRFVVHLKPGTYPFLCLIHQFMTGTLIVVK